MDTTKEINRLLENFWTWRLQNCPEFATFCGIHDYDDKLESFSSEDIEEGKIACQQFKNDALNLLSGQNLESEAQRNLLNLVDELKTYLDGSKARGYFFRISYLDGPQNEFNRLIAAMPLNNVKDFNNVLSRYNKLPVQISQIIHIMKEGISQNMTLHKKSVELIPEQIDLFDQLAVLEDKPEECFFYKPFMSLPDSLAVQEKEAILSEAMKSIKHSVLPAFKELKDFFEKEYFNHTRPEIGVSTLPNGEAFYQMCLDFHLSCHMTPEQVHAMGLQEVERISSKVKKVIKSLNLDMTVKEFSEKMRRDEQFYFKDPEELLSAYKHLVFDKIHPLLPKVFKTIPKSKLEIRPTEPSMSGGPSAYYLAGTVDGKVPGVFYADVVGCDKSAPKYEMVTLALHEALPGHHLQLSHMMEDKGLPSYRRFVEDRKHSQAPSRFPLHTAYMEGWGLYCEYLGYELGLYEDPYDQYPAKKMMVLHVYSKIQRFLVIFLWEMLRAARLVVDTGIHAFGWSFDKAVEYMLDHTAATKSDLEREVRRYITLPGQACAYKVGELKLKSLRKEAEIALGSRFSVTEFHDMVLHNFGPLNILEQKTMEFIKANA